VIQASAAAVAKKVVEVYFPSEAAVALAAVAKGEVVVYSLEVAVGVTDMYFVEVLEHKVHQRGNIPLQVLVGRSVGQKMVDGVALAVVQAQGYMFVDAADMDRNEVVVGVVVDRIAGAEVGKVEFVDTMGYNLDYLV
jgi:hypothetical protein